ncbi:superoxide dismutase [Pasteurellaceae bacterium Pebbles2]|nr:superoxide dismutase [Pasteurellaceae bacterium Pebbles2]
MKKTLLALSLITVAASAVAHSDQPMATDGLKIDVQLLDPVKGNQDAGHIYVTESNYGLVFTPDLKGLSAGLHGFHVHENGSCDAKEKDGKLTAGLAAGGHWDPKQTKKHGFPWSDDAHLGDLPALYVDAEGNATYPVLAPRLKTLSEVKGHAVMIHAGGDNHSDHPAPLGGGGARMACGVIK